tara:strand:+ start:274 stop:504 length:231 start_codon:yes stop_codon:yes gene_type:complete
LKGLIHKYSFFSIIGVRLVIKILGMVIESSYQSQAIKAKLSKPSYQKPSYQKPRIILAIIKTNDKTNDKTNNAGSQ